ncbi:hypothetical protein [Kineosporia babensis]|uniref:Uncharacterized protein n=1 Tax=Kineosporia babensis TaxID=499548 RepID=A0A9X1N9W2_9ACTN|nr:hypothetical protein [Kineosporia babensis]MCD5309974.1 hypothetical protein [Kineosporia babensis]
MIDIDVLSTAADLKEFDAATVAAYCHTDEDRVVLVLDEHHDLFAKRIARHQAQPSSPRYRVLHPDALARRISSLPRTKDFAPSPWYDQPSATENEPPPSSSSRPRPPRSSPRPRRPERGDQPAPRFTQRSFTSGGYTSTGAPSLYAYGDEFPPDRTPSARPKPQGQAPRNPAPRNQSNRPPRNAAPWNRPTAARLPNAAQAPRRQPAPIPPHLPQLGAPSVPNPASMRSSAPPDLDDVPSLHDEPARLDRLEVIHTRDPEPDPRITHAESSLLTCAREPDPQARHALASAAMSALSECVPNLPRDGELHTAELPVRLRFALTLATLTLIESTGQPIARKLLISAYDDAAAAAQEFLPARQADLISRFRALASGRSVDYRSA